MREERGEGDGEMREEKGKRRRESGEGRRVYLGEGGKCPVAFRSNAASTLRGEDDDGRKSFPHHLGMGVE